MEIKIFNVEHGSCAVIETPNGQLLMIDCGHNPTLNWRPSSWLVQNNLTLHGLFISNLDEDHVSDLPNISQFCAPSRFGTNWFITPQWLRAKKLQGGRIGPGINAALDLMGRYDSPASQVDYGVEIRRFCHSTDTFNDTNNLSLVHFFFLGSFGILFPGDLEKAGWLQFLANRDFVSCLERTTILVASHHGRDSGFESSAFTYMRPELVIFSDSGIQYDTQRNMAGAYGQYASGVVIKNRRRYVLSTRQDGVISFSIENSGGGRVVTGI